MTDNDGDSYLSLLEANHFTLVKSIDPVVFLDYLRQHQILSEDDCQIIQNQYVNQSRRQRMRCFLDVLRLKGPEGIQMFWKQLGWEYPHVYKDIFREDPEKAPSTYRQSEQSRLSCDLNQLLTFGLDMTRIKNQRNNLAEQIKEMEDMLKHQKNEIEDLERENQRLRQYERDNIQTKEKLKTLTANNDEIKEENRLFLHEIRTLTLEVQKLRDQEALLQAKLDEQTEQVREKSLELNRKSKEENDLRDKLDRAVKASIRFSPARSKLSDIASRAASANKASHATTVAIQQQQNLHQQMEILIHDMKELEETNSGLCDQLQYMQSLLDEAKMERDEMHRNVVVLEHNKNTMESRQNTNLQKIERYFSRIKELEEEKKKLEEDRVQHQIRMWEMNMENQKQFEQLHKAETRFENLQQSYDQFRQDHRNCIPGDDVHPQMRKRVPLARYPRSPGISPAIGKGIDDPFQFFASGYPSANSHLCPEPSSSADNSAPDGDPTVVLPTTGLQPRTDSLIVEPSASMKRKNVVRVGDLSDKEEDSEQDEKASTVSEVSSVSSTASNSFDALDLNPSKDRPQHDNNAAQENGTSSQAGNFFLRSNVQDDGDAVSMAVKEGEILYVDEVDDEHWVIMRVDRASGKVHHDQRGQIANPDRLRCDITTGQVVLRTPSDKKAASLSRTGAIRRDGMKPEHSTVAAFATVCPMKATRKLPVLLLCPPSVTKTLLSRMETTAKDWAIVDREGHVETMQLFAESTKHYVIPWEVRPKHPHHVSANLHKFIILVITLQSAEALSSLRVVLEDPSLTLDYDQEMKYVTELMEMVRRAGLHSESIVVAEGPADRKAFWTAVESKVSMVQERVFWLETHERRLEKQ